MGRVPLTAIKLTQNWILGARIGSGGFGQVFAAENEDGLKAAVKLVPKAPGADRELLFVDLKGVRGIVPVIDSGEHGDRWVLVMPRADQSLRQHLMGAAEWIETAFMVSPTVPKTTVMRPFMADPGVEAAKALWAGMAEFQLAWPIERVDAGAFIDRWADWLADAAQGRL